MNKDLEKLQEQENENNKLMVALALFVGFCVFIILYSFASIYHHFTSNESKLVSCPKSIHLDTPVTLTPVNNTSTKEKDKWIRGFVRKYVTALYPRTKRDVRPFVDYLVNHSKGNVKTIFDSFEKSIEDYEALIESGYKIIFYPKSTMNTKIRSTGSDGQWIVEIEGYLVKKLRLNDERSTPTLRLTIEVGDQNSLNPEGLYVSEIENETIADFVSGRKE